jgi:hypothetical protein
MITKNPTGYVIYKGPSLLDGAPIVVIATTKSKNEKTANMVQTWILREDVNPLEASRSGADASVCGSCPLRGKANLKKTFGGADDGACYVMLKNAPLSVWNGYKRGIYPMARTIDAIAAIGAGRMVRTGSYGDGAAVPAWVTNALESEALGHTAYSHQANNPGSSFDPARYMVSVQSESEAREAWDKGWRTFRVVANASDAVIGQEIECPSARGVSCADCGLCAGTQRRAKSIVIPSHDSGRKAANAVVRHAA